MVKCLYAEFLKLHIRLRPVPTGLRIPAFVYLFFFLIGGECQFDKLITITRMIYLYSLTLATVFEWWWTPTSQNWRRANVFRPGVCLSMFGYFDVSGICYNFHTHDHRISLWVCLELKQKYIIIRIYVERIFWKSLSLLTEIFVLEHDISRILIINFSFSTLNNNQFEFLFYFFGYSDVRIFQYMKYKR